MFDCMFATPIKTVIQPYTHNLKKPELSSLPCTCLGERGGGGNNIEILLQLSYRSFKLDSINASVTKQQTLIS